MNNPDRSAAIAKSWKNANTAIKRTTRHAVKASGKNYRSTRAAFISLGLPLENHIAFRMKLKAEGTAVYPFGDRRKVTFSLVI